MKPYSECDESPVVVNCKGCDELCNSDEGPCPYCDEDTLEAFFERRDRRRNRAADSDEWHIGDMV